MGLISRVFSAFFEALSDPPPLRTLCCGALMHDMWMHAETCPQLVDAMAKTRAWQAANPGKLLVDRPSEKLRRGDHSTMCPDCGYPVGFFGLYIVGDKCPYCGYVERRCT